MTEPRQLRGFAAAVDLPHLQAVERDRTTASARTIDVWIVSELYYPEETSTGYFVTGIAEGLASSFRTGAICSRPTYAARSTPVAWRERRGEVEIVRCWSTRLDPHKLLSRTVNLVTGTLSMFATICRHAERGQIVIALTNPPTLPFAALAACRFRGARCVVLVHDVYPDVLAAAGLLRRSSIIYRLLDFAARAVLRRADHVIVLGSDMARVINAKTGTPDRVSIIPNWGDVAAAAPRAARAKLVVQYSGNIGRTHDVATILDAAEALRDDASIEFAIVGWGARRNDLEKEIARRSLTNVVLQPPVARQDLAASLADCDVAIVSMIRGMAGLSVPSRLYNILAAGRPFIAVADPDSEPAMIAQEASAGWVVAPGDAASLTAAIRAAKNDRAALAEMGQRARHLAEKSYTREGVVDLYRRLVERLLNE